MQVIRDVVGELLETGKATVQAGKKTVADPVVQDEDQQQKEQIKRLSDMDKRRSRQAYEEIQRQIQLIQRQKASQPRKYMTGATGFDEEQVKSPETFFDKMKKKKEEMSKKLPWTSKQGMGTGEITRGVSG